MTATASSSVAARPGHDVLSRIVTAGVAGGLVDFAYASVMGALSGRGVVKVWQGVASGWIGKAAGQGGLGSFALGVVTHFGIATAMAAAYALAASRFPILYRRWVVCGALYGVILYGVMYRIVLKLRFGGGDWRGALSLLDIAAHVGLALAAVYVLSRPAKSA